MKTPLLLLALLIASSVSLPAQAPSPGVVSSTAVSARDGFTRGGTAITFTRNGVSQKVEKEVILENGLRVRPDGSVILPNGQNATLGNNQILTLQGVIEDTALTQQGTAPVTSGGAPMKKQGEEVGLAAHDGISVSGGEALVTRNGVTERMAKELKLANGTRVQPNGGVTMPDGTQITLKAEQVLTFDGVVRDIPQRPNTNPGSPNLQSPR